MKVTVPESDAGSEKNNGTVGLIIGSVVAGIVLLAVILAVVIVVVVRRRYV